MTIMIVLAHVGPKTQIDMLNLPRMRNKTLFMGNYHVVIQFISNVIISQTSFIQSVHSANTNKLHTATRV